MSVLSARDGYRLWAPTYEAETAISFLDQQLAAQMLDRLPRKQLLDAGCGTGRRLAGISGAIGVDASPEMIVAGGATNLMVGDVRALPFPPGRFDMVWCRLVLGHLADPVPAYRELARVCRPNGHVFITDFHPDAVAAGGRRTFREQTGGLHEVEHYVHDHLKIAEASGLLLLVQRDAGVGPAVRDFYVRAGKLSLYEENRGLKLVDAFLFRPQN